MSEPKSDAIETRLIHLGSDPESQCGFVNPPIYRGSTALYGNLRTMDESSHDPWKKILPTYGRFGTPTSRAFEDAMTELEGGFDTVLTNTGLSAITTTLLAFLKSGDHLLVTDSVYWPTRNFCDSLKRFGIETEFYDPRVGAGIGELFRENTRAVVMESPGSLTFEVQDLPAMIPLCRARGILTVVDNTWATPLFFRPLDLGADFSLHAATKYITGHSDSFLGAIIAGNENAYSLIRASAIQLGQCAAPDDVYLALRGLRTLSVRLQQHQTQAIALATWLTQQSEVADVYHPALPSHPDHEIWRRDFRGSTGLFAFTLKSAFSRENVNTMVEGLRLFGLGHSWGGYESLLIPSDPASFRKAGAWSQQGALLRVHAGLENLTDLQNDLAHAFARLKSTSML